MLRYWVRTLAIHEFISAGLQGDIFGIGSGISNFTVLLQDTILSRVILGLAGEQVGDADRLSYLRGCIILGGRISDGAYLRTRRTITDLRYL